MTAIRPSKKSIEPMMIINQPANAIHPIQTAVLRNGNALDGQPGGQLLEIGSRPVASTDDQNVAVLAGDQQSWRQAGEDQPTCRSGLAGRSRAAPRPMSPNTATATIAHVYARFPVATTETRIVPAIAVPKDEPRLDTLRERPEISP